jgi:hypothetical protein
MMKWGSNLSSALIGSGPQNNMEGLLVSVSEFGPQALFQGCTYTGFGLDHLAAMTEKSETGSLDSMLNLLDMHF